MADGQGRCRVRKSKESVTITSGSRSVTVDADRLTRMSENGAIPFHGGRMQADAPVGRGKQKSFGFDTTHEFLGEEFLTWLWFKCETDGGEFHLADDRVVGIAIDDLLQFAPLGDDDHEQTIRHGLPTQTAEARAGLRQGHRLAKARLLVATGAQQWSVVLDAARMGCSSAKLPDDDEECESAEDRTTDRATNWIALHDIVAELFRAFLVVRLSPAWLRGDAAAMAAWMAS